MLLEHYRAHTASSELIHSHTTHRKGGVLLGVFGHLDLPKTQFQVHGGEEPGAYHGLHGLLHLGKGVGILLGPAIQSVEINTEPEAPILFAHQNHCITPRDWDGCIAPPSSIS